MNQIQYLKLKIQGKDLEILHLYYLSKGGVVKSITYFEGVLIRWCMIRGTYRDEICDHLYRMLDSGNYKWQ